MKRLLALLLLLVSWGALAQQALEVITLKHRSAEEVLPVLRPLVEPRGALTGEGTKLFLRASAANRAEIRKALAAMDTPRRRLLITVLRDSQGRLDAAAMDALASKDLRAILEAGGDTAPGSPERRRDEALRARSYSTVRSPDDGVAQRLQVLEGSSAFIRVGASLPMRLYSVFSGQIGSGVSEQVVFRDVGSGFYAKPAVHGDQVTVDIAPEKESLTDDGGVRHERLMTRVSGRLGQWLELGGTDRDDSLERPGTAVYSTRGARERSRFLMKVEELP